MKFSIENGSIKSRLVMIILICVAGMVILAANQIYNTNSFIELNEQNKQLLNLKSELLQLRRHEKDFLLRHEYQYVEKFSQRAETFSHRLDHLEEFFSDYPLGDNLFTNVRNSFTQYRQQFFELAAINNLIGLDEDSGYQGQFRQATHKLEEQLFQGKQTEWQLLLLQLRRNEKDFMLRKEMRYVKAHNQLYMAFKSAVSRSSKANQKQLLSLLDGYQNGFMQLVQAYQQIGLDHHSGLQGSFRQQAHDVEAQLVRLNKNLEQMLTNASGKVKRNGFMIMTGTSLVLIILFIRSFISLQRAFNTFGMFFYRCKREYQHIDERKQGFSEFKYLASIANEMIDARREIELELKRAQQHISEIGNPQQTKPQNSYTNT